MTQSVLRSKGKQNQFSAVKLSTDVTAALLKEKYHDANINLKEPWLLFGNCWKLLNIRVKYDTFCWKNHTETYQWWLLFFFSPVPSASAIDWSNNSRIINKEPYRCLCQTSWFSCRASSRTWRSPRMRQCRPWPLVSPATSPLSPCSSTRSTTTPHSPTTGWVNNILFC